MAQEEPALLSKAVTERLNKMLGNSGHLRGPTDFERARFERDFASIEKDDAAQAYALRAAVAQLDGDIDSVERHIAAARHLHAQGVDAILADAYANLGYASRALAHLRTSMRGGVPDLSGFFQAALNSGSATTVARVVDEAGFASQGLSQRANELIPWAHRVAAALAASGHTEDQLAAVIDVAGEVMRENKLLWLDRMPTIIAEAGEETDDSAPGVHYYFRVDVPPEVGAALTGEIGWRLVDRDLTFPALTVSLVGVGKEEALSA